MGLIKCPDCGKEFSDRIDSCPNCSCPIEDARRANEIDFHEELEELDVEPKVVGIKYKDRLMSHRELYVFVVNNIMPIIIKELGGNVKIMEGNKKKNEPEFYLKTPDDSIGLNFVISIAPCKSSEGYDPDLAESLYNRGYKFAVARVGVGASNPDKFDRMVVEKNDDYYFDYKELQFFDYKSIQSVRYSLGEDTSYREIYDRPEPVENPYIIQKPKKTYNLEYYGKEDVKAVLEKYGIYEQFYIDYFDIIGSTVGYRISYKDLVVGFLNCVDICDGLILSDDKKVDEKNIIKECIKYFKTNALVNLEKYDIYWLSYYIYYYLTNGRNKTNIIPLNELKRMKIELYEKDPSIFGF